MAAFNGTGTYVRSYNWQVDKINGVKIRADRMDTEMDGFALGLSTCVTHDGQSPATANLPMGGFKHTGVADGTTRDQYASVGQVQDGENNWGGTSVGAANIYTIGLTPSITAYAANMTVSFIAHQTNTGASTITVDGLASKNIRKGDGTEALSSGDIRINSTITLKYDGTQFILQSAASGATAAADFISYVLF